MQAVRLYYFRKSQYKNIEIESLKATAKKRGSTEVLKKYRNNIDGVRKSDVMMKQWKTYQKDFEDAEDIGFDEICDAVVRMMDVCLCC